MSKAYRVVHREPGLSLDQGGIRVTESDALSNERKPRPVDALPEGGPQPLVDVGVGRPLFFRRFCEQPRPARKRPLELRVAKQRQSTRGEKPGQCSQLGVEGARDHDQGEGGVPDRYELTAFVLGLLERSQRRLRRLLDPAIEFQVEVELDACRDELLEKILEDDGFGLPLVAVVPPSLQPEGQEDAGDDHQPLEQQAPCRSGSRV